tara:strand:+ start:14613 stop:14801 length:189 start_codon:yes stop_codon:yes gene_type:complete
MIICLCKNISSKKVEELYCSGLSKKEIKNLTGITRQCGTCKYCFDEKIENIEKKICYNNKKE